MSGSRAVFVSEIPFLIRRIWTQAFWKPYLWFIVVSWIDWIDSAWYVFLKSLFCLWQSSYQRLWPKGSKLVGWASQEPHQLQLCKIIFLLFKTCFKASYDINTVKYLDIHSYSTSTSQAPHGYLYSGRCSWETSPAASSIVFTRRELHPSSND